jgi:hypothetical protein
MDAALIKEQNKKRKPKSLQEMTGVLFLFHRFLEPQDHGCNINN